MIHKIKALHNEGAGLSIRSIARELGISRNTVRKYLRMDEVAIGEEQERRTRHKQLDDYRDSIVTLLEQFTNLTEGFAPAHRQALIISGLTRTMDDIGRPGPSHGMVRSLRDTHALPMPPGLRAAWRSRGKVP